jgi:5'-3' exoribonuclease 2
VRFELGKPFRPFDQLMSVFPAASADHIPEPFRKLMLSHESDILEFYPDDFSVDLNGKKHAWQGVALLPFIDEDRLLAALERVYPELDEAHLKLNERGHDLLFVGEASTCFGFLCTIDADPDGIWPLDSVLTRGLAGSVRHHRSGHPVGSTVPAPFPSKRDVCPDIEGSKVVSALFYPMGVGNQESTLKVHFRARMLPTARLPPRVLDGSSSGNGGYSSATNSYGNYQHRTGSSYQQQKQQQQHQHGQSYFRPPNPDYARRHY